MTSPLPPPDRERDIAELRRLLPLITPLPYWIEPAQPTLLHGYRRTLDAYIACGTPGDPSDTFDLIERYDVDTDYVYLVAAANAVPALLARLDAAEAQRTHVLAIADMMELDDMTEYAYMIRKALGEAAKEPGAIDA